MAETHPPFSLLARSRVIGLGALAARSDGGWPQVACAGAAASELRASGMCLLPLRAGPAGRGGGVFVVEADEELRGLAPPSPGTACKAPERPPSPPLRGAEGLGTAASVPVRAASVPVRAAVTDLSESDAVDQLSADGDATLADPVEEGRFLIESGGGGGGGAVATGGDRWRADRKSVV